MSLPVNRIEFAQDTEERRKWFRAASFSHPAKMVLGLQIYLIEHYTKPGETILDPMAGSGTVLVGCALGRNVICVELEKKFIKMQQDNWQKIKSLGAMLGYKMGEATILQGDARALPELLVDKCVFSPPYAETSDRQAWSEEFRKKAEAKHKRTYTKASFKDERYGESNGQISSLPYGEISAVISSPPYNAEPTVSESYKKIRSKMRRDITKPSQQYAKYADAVITSPPYEAVVKTGDGAIGEKDDYYKGISHKERLKRRKTGEYAYSGDNSNIGNLKSDNYLEAMLAVYQGCYRVLKDGGLLCLVVKNFIRDKKIVRLDLDTIKLCEKAGFVLKERLARKLTHQSFWRIISLMKCDHRKGSGEDIRCELGLECPAELSDTHLWDLLRNREDNVEYAKKVKRRIEKRCPQFINTMPKIEFEDVLIFTKTRGFI